ncbi:hypothetical protein HMPREF1864_00884 [Peptoniphilus sp. DNF00840]|nr:hypothetical protein HMPREF1864_00884 [Peptoniphilus sp. DNF00840]
MSHTNKKALSLNSKLVTLYETVNKHSEWKNYNLLIFFLISPS